MMNRRKLFVTSAAAAAAGTALAAGREAAAATINAAKVDPRGHEGIFERLPSLDLESHHDFLKGGRTWTSTSLYRAADKRVQEIFKAQGVDMRAEIPLEQVIDLVGNDPVVALTGKAFLDGQYYKFKTLLDEFHGKSDLYLSELETAEKLGPKLELNPKLDIPAYCKHEIHTQPGGYCSDPFAGYVYHYGTTILNDGRGEQDEGHMRSASGAPKPADGKVQRILDLGTGPGQLATSFKKRFPEAEVWGIDVGAPMVRYAHMRAVDIGVEVHFKQCLAEATGFPDNHFDIISSYLLHHEMESDANRAMIKEVQRILRPGGVFYPIDLYSASPPSKQAWDRYRTWWTYRWNGEHFYLDYGSMGFNDHMRKVGLKVDEKAGPPGSMTAGNYSAMGAARNVVAIKV